MLFRNYLGFPICDRILIHQISIDIALDIIPTRRFTALRYPRITAYTPRYGCRGLHAHIDLRLLSVIAVETRVRSASETEYT